MMRCAELAARIEKLDPHADPRDVARLCAVLANTCDDWRSLEDPERLEAARRRAVLQLHAAEDQHAAVMEELERLGRSDPRRFSPDQIWVLVRAIKVQSQLLHVCAGQPVLDV